VSWYQKGKTNLDFTEARDSEWQWHQMGHMPVCTSLQRDNHASTQPLSFLQAGCPSCCPTNSVKALKAKRAVLKKMKRHKAPALPGLVAEMIQATGDIATQWLLDLCNGIVKEGSIPEDWKSSVVLPIYEGKVDPIKCGPYRGIKLLEHAMKVAERISEHRIRQQIEIDDMQFGFMKGKGTTDAIFMARQTQQNFRLKVRSSILFLWIWRKFLMGCQEK